MISRWIAPAALALVFLAPARAAEFATPGSPEPSNLDEVYSHLREDPYDMELLISFGTSKGGSAGHVALALRDEVPDDDMVYSANYYADRTPEHERDHYTADLMVRMPKKEYLYKTSSSLGEKASFGLDFGEVYKRSVVGVRVYGVPAAERQALAAYFARMNDDYHAKARDTEYQDGEVTYDYLHLNCAKTIGSAFRYGAHYRDLEIKSPAILRNRRVMAATNSNVPTEMAMKLMKEWHVRGYRLDAVLYKKYAASPYVDPYDEKPIAFKDLPNRFPSVLSLDFRNDEGVYQDYDNLYAMYLLFNVGRYSVRIDPATHRMEIDQSKQSSPYEEAAQNAARDAGADSKGFLQRLLFTPKGKPVGDL